nr:hypothetical protein [Tanacetum cinerariifolium]
MERVVVDVVVAAAMVWRGGDNEDEVEMVDLVAMRMMYRGTWDVVGKEGGDLVQLRCRGNTGDERGIVTEKGRET